jgi:general secretion pathway protein G
MTDSRNICANRQGFTLVEMLLVLVILSTLAAISYPMLIHRTEDGRIAAAKVQIANFKTALNAFEVDNGFYPNALTDLIQQPRDAANWRGPYIEAIPNDPWGRPYQYFCPGKHNPAFFDISSAGSPRFNVPIGNWLVKESSVGGQSISLGVVPLIARGHSS